MGTLLIRFFAWAPDSFFGWAPDSPENQGRWTAGSRSTRRRRGLIRVSDSGSGEAPPPSACFPFARLIFWSGGEPEFERMARATALLTTYQTSEGVLRPDCARMFTQTPLSGAVNRPVRQDACLKARSGVRARIPTDISSSDTSPNSLWACLRSAHGHLND